MLRERRKMRYVSHLECSTCGASYPADRVMNLCERDGRPVRMVLDLDRLRAERGRDGGWDPSRLDLWRFGGLLPLDVAEPDDRRHIVTLGEGYTPSLEYRHPWADRLRCRFEVKDEGRPHAGFGANPTLSFKDRGMALTVSMAKALGLSRLAVPTQGNAGDSLAEYAVAGGIEAAVVMSPDTDLPVLGRVAALARLHPGNVTLELVPGTIIDCARARPRASRAGRLLQRRDVPGAGMADRGEEDPRPGDGRAARRPPRRADLEAPRRDRLPDRRRDGGGRHGQGVRRAGGAGPGRAGSAADGLRPELLLHPDRPGVRRRGGRHHPPAPLLDDRHGPERREERRARPGLADHPRDRGLRRGRLRRERSAPSSATNGASAGSAGRPRGPPPWPHSPSWPIAR